MAPDREAWETCQTREAMWETTKSGCKLRSGSRILADWGVAWETTPAGSVMSLVRVQGCPWHCGQTGSGMGNHSEPSMSSHQTKLGVQEVVRG